jgi:HK97 family phage major capsid protein
MMESAVTEDPLLSLLDSYAVSAKSDRVNWQELAEDNVSTTVFGGIRAYWAAEAATATATKPQMREMELKLEKLMAFYYNTLELEADSTFNSTVAMRGLTTAIRRELAAAVYNGNGVGKPLGMLQSPGLVSVAKEGGQTADTIVWENISKMYNRTKGPKSEFVWLIHPDCNYQLEQMVKVVGTGGAPIYQMATLPDSVDTLRGRRVLESDQCQALGDKGDIMLVNPKEYVLLYKGGIQADSSIHVGFLTAENCFRVIFRCNGFPKNRSALTIKNSAATRSSIISLDARA